MVYGMQRVNRVYKCEEELSFALIHTIESRVGLLNLKDLNKFGRPLLPFEVSSDPTPPANNKYNEDHCFPYNLVINAVRVYNIC